MAVSILHCSQSMEALCLLIFKRTWIFSSLVYDLDFVDFSGGEMFQLTTKMITIFPEIKLLNATNYVSKTYHYPRRFALYNHNSY